MRSFLKKYWFMVGLALVFLITVFDTTGAVSKVGRWAKGHDGPSIAIFLIFFLSGLMLKPADIRSGATDIKGVVIALGIGFVAAPALALVFGQAPLPAGVVIGLFLVSVMPSTLSSGVVMTGAAGGNMAHALLITIVSNFLAVFTIPLALSILLQTGADAQVIRIDKVAMMTKIGVLVLLPLSLGMIVKLGRLAFIEDRGRQVQMATQGLILTIVWMGLSQTRSAILDNALTMGVVMVLVMVFHGSVLVAAVLLTRWFNLKKGRRESVIFMGSQKTLPLSILLQVSLFPQFPLALVVCVTHHLIHLFMDGYLVARFKSYEG